MLTTDEAAEIIGIHPQSLRRWCREGEHHPPFSQTGGKEPKRYFRRDEVEAWADDYKGVKRVPATGAGDPTRLVMDAICAGLGCLEKGWDDSSLLGRRMGDGRLVSPLMDEDLPDGHQVVCEVCRTPYVVRDRWLWSEEIGSPARQQSYR